MLSYPARIIHDGDGFMVSFPDIPEALTGAPTKEEAQELAADALLTAMDFYFEDRREVPPPSALKRGQVEHESNFSSFFPYFHSRSGRLGTDQPVAILIEAGRCETG